MPTNVTPEYRKAEHAFRRSRDPADRLTWLKEMLRTIPKHKGTEHVQADIKTRIKQLTDQIAGPKKKGGRPGPTYSVRPAGAAQIALLGPPNAGKSSLHARLTGSHTEIGAYPFTTQLPVPGMLPHEDIQFQLIDLPPITEDYFEPWFPNALEQAEAALLVIDVNDAACVEQVRAVCDRLSERKIALLEDWPGLRDDDVHRPVHESAHSYDEAGSKHDSADGEELEDPFRIHLPTLLIANKCDLEPEPDEVKVLEELLGITYPAITTSAETGQGLDEIGPLLFEGLRIVRVYTKAPNRPPEHDHPFAVHKGQTVADVAQLVHKDIASNLKFARMWGDGVFDGQQVGPDHVVEDRNIVELHTH